MSALWGLSGSPQSRWFLAHQPLFAFARRTAEGSRTKPALFFPTKSRARSSTKAGKAQGGAGGGGKPLTCAEAEACGGLIILLPVPTSTLTPSHEASLGLLVAIQTLGVGLHRPPSCDCSAGTAFPQLPFAVEFCISQGLGRLPHGCRGQPGLVFANYSRQSLARGPAAPPPGPFPPRHLLHLPSSSAGAGLEFPEYLCESLEVLYLNSNQLNAVPLSVCLLSSLSELYLGK